MNTYATLADCSRSRETHEAWDRRCDARTETWKCQLAFSNLYWRIPSATGFTGESRPTAEALFTLRSNRRKVASKSGKKTIINKREIARSDLRARGRWRIGKSGREKEERSENETDGQRIGENVFHERETVTKHLLILDIMTYEMHGRRHL